MTAAARHASRLPSDYGWVNADREEAPGYERSEAQIDYEILRDTIIAAFNPPDDDAAEPAIMTAAIDRAWAFIVAQPCTCEPGAADLEVDECDRCNALGRAYDVVIER